MLPLGVVTTDGTGEAESEVVGTKGIYPDGEGAGAALANGPGRDIIGGTAEKVGTAAATVAIGCNCCADGCCADGYCVWPWW